MVYVRELFSLNIIYLSLQACLPVYNDKDGIAIFVVAATVGSKAHGLSIDALASICCGRVDLDYT